MPSTCYLLTRRTKYVDLGSGSAQSMDGIFGIVVARALEKAIPWIEVSDYFRVSPEQTLLRLEIPGASPSVCYDLTPDCIRELDEFLEVKKIPEGRYRELLLKGLNADEKKPTGKA